MSFGSSAASSQSTNQRQPSRAAPAGIAGYAVSWHVPKRLGTPAAGNEELETYQELARAVLSGRALSGTSNRPQPGRPLEGEALDRAYYGDSVRLAERRWQDYCRTLRVSNEAC